MHAYSALTGTVFFDDHFSHRSSDFIDLMCGTQVLGFFNKCSADDSDEELRLRCLFLRKYKEAYKAMIYFTCAHYLIVLKSCL